jgi:hypothetical protein
MERELAQKSHMEELGRMAAPPPNVKTRSAPCVLAATVQESTIYADQREEVRMMIREIDRCPRP